MIERERAENEMDGLRYIQNCHINDGLGIKYMKNTTTCKQHMKNHLDITLKRMGRRP